MRSDGFFRRLRLKIWSSPAYLHGRRAAVAIARPFWVFELAIVFRQPLTDRLKILNADIDLDIIGPASPADVVRAAESVGRILPGRADHFRRRLRDGCVCFLARAGPALAAYAWMRYRPGANDGNMIALAEGEVYHFDGYVADTWRGHRIHPALSSHLLRYDRDQGYTTAYTLVSLFNRKSQKTVQRIGFKPSGIVLRVRGSMRGGWPIVTLWGSSHPLTRLPRVSDSLK